MEKQERLTRERINGLGKKGERNECIYENFKKINKQKIKFDLYFRNISQNLEIRNEKDYETSLFLKNENVIKIST